MRTREYLRASHTQWRNRNRERLLAQNAKSRAARLGVPFDITHEDIVIPEYCPVLGIKLSRDKRATMPSLDRFRPELGYVRGNIAVISYRANTIKHNASTEEVERVATWMRRTGSA
jgi:hypothetical protein